MARKVYVVPGILGSEIFQDQPILPNLLWVQPARLALGHVTKLTLGPGGIQPDPSIGDTCYAGEPLVDYYGQAADRLAKDLPASYSVIRYGYDWRRDLSLIGRSLAGLISGQSSASEPASIVAHSQGGLIARMAWYCLFLSGETAKLRRIVTIGTPHEGCYKPNEVLCGRDEVIDQIRLAETFTAGLTDLSPIGGITGLPHSRDEIAAVIASWPSVFQLMPLVNPETLQDDPWRSRNYNKEAWLPRLAGRTQWLDYASGPWSAILNSHQSQPPTDVLIAVGATGFDTLYAIKGSGNVQDASSYYSNAEGDGTVYLGSAIPPWATGEIVWGEHGDLMLRSYVLANLARWVLLDIPTPPEPTGPIGLQPPLTFEVPGRLVAGPPFTVDPALFFDP